MKVFGMCINWRVLVGVGVIAAGLFAFAPNLAAAALPFLILAICPLSMLLMMTLMGNNGSQQSAACATDDQQVPLSREEKLAQLKAQQQELASQLAALEAEARTEPEVSAQGRQAIQPS